ncbi:hypothetical protein GGR58DRAFT_528307 [Xylaria digitata]|nr:hypothetical protein GGR58DRAFT_528307 [Xylaria digitata]
MSGGIDVSSILDGVISRSAARRRAAAEEVIRLRSEEKIARTVRRLVSEAQASLRATLSEELAKIASDTEKQLETVRQEFQQGSVDTSDKNDHATSDENDFIPELFHVGVDFLKEYRILQEESIDTDRGEHGLSTTLEPDDGDRAAADVVELMQHSMNLLSGAEDEFTQLIINPPVAAAGTSNRFDANPESDDEKGWLRDDDDGDLAEVIVQEDGACLPRHGVQTGDLSSGRSSVHTIRSTPRNSQRPSSRRIILESDEEEENQGDRPSSKASNSTGDIDEEIPSRLPLRYKFPIVTPQGRPRHSEVPGPSSLPTTIRGRSESPTLPRKATKSKEYVDPYRQRSSNFRPPASQPVNFRRESNTASRQSSSRRRQPIRQSTTVPHTYNVRKIFTNRVGSLDGPEYWMVKSGE